MNTKLENKLLLYKKRSIMTKFLGPCNCCALAGGVRGGGISDELGINTGI